MSLEDRARHELEEDAPRVTLRPVDLGGLLTAPAPAPPYVVDRLIPRGTATLLGAHGGVGKSNLALAIAAHVAGGAHTWAGHQVEDGHALYVSLEDSGEVVRYRLRNIIEAYGLDADKVARRLTVVDGTAGEAALGLEINELGVRRLALTATYIEVAKLAEGMRLIVVDNASDAYDANENERRMVRAFIRSLAKIASDNDAGLILLAHIDKGAARNGSQGNSYSGSTAWHNSARSRLALIRDESGAVELVPEKLNFGKLADPIPLKWSERGVLLPVSRPAGDLGRGDTEHVLAAMRAAQAAGVDVGAARLGSTTTQTLLATFDEMPKHLRGTNGRNAFWTAVNKLQADGKVVKTEITTQHRKQKTVLVLADCAESIPKDLRAPNPHTPMRSMARIGAPDCVESAPNDSAQFSAAAYRAAKDGE